MGDVNIADGDGERIYIVPDSGFAPGGGVNVVDGYPGFPGHAGPVGPGFGGNLIIPGYPGDGGVQIADGGGVNVADGGGVNFVDGGGGVNVSDGSGFAYAAGPMARGSGEESTKPAEEKDEEEVAE